VVRCSFRFGAPRRVLLRKNCCGLVDLVTGDIRRLCLVLLGAWIEGMSNESWWIRAVLGLSRHNFE
jgi:hypothetical protein